MRASVTDRETGTRYKRNSWESSESQHSTPAAQAGVSAATPKQDPHGRNTSARAVIANGR